MDLVDVHCHINHELFKNDLDEVIERARKGGVKRILVSGVNPEANWEVLQYVKKYPDILRASLGVYPIDALGLTPDAVGLPFHKGKINLEEEFAFFEKNKAQITAIGEVGMDFHWAEKEKTYNEQAETFRKIIRFAIKLKKPLVIHSRKAEAECVQILGEEIAAQEIPVVQHCFSGKKDIIRKAAALGHYFSVPANVVKSSQFQTLVKIVDLKQLLTETDAPWLTPYGERSEPSYVKESIKMIAQIKSISIEEAAKAVWENYVRVFGDK
ncbi:MAG: TatD family hydrolase [Nanoarchaeota archaeon]